MMPTAPTTRSDLVLRIDAVLAELKAIADSAETLIAPEVAADLRQHRDAFAATQRALAIALWGEPVEGYIAPHYIGSLYASLREPVASGPASSVRRIGTDARAARPRS